MRIALLDVDGHNFPNLPLCEYRTDEIEVIGNVFDNPEYLKAGQQSAPHNT